MKRYGYMVGLTQNYRHTLVVCGTFGAARAAALADRYAGYSVGRVYSADSDTYVARLIRSGYGYGRHRVA